MNFKAVIFDLDGTLLDTLEDIANSTNKVLNSNGFPTHPLNRYCNFAGSGLEVLINRVLPEGRRDEATIEKCVQGFREDYKQNWNIKTKPYDGIADLLDTLNDRKIKLAVLSNKPHDFTLQCVNDMLSNWHFERVQGLHEGLHPKPDPAGAQQIADFLKLSPGEILYVGDTDIDMETATAAGMFPCGVLWGFRSKKELEESGARALIEHPSEILNLLD
ncbi:MAG: HAD family hydrolase [Proteobacteria bacterium]|nr:HAD family hydrolase [Pseudomonadota bacterium]